MNKRGDLISREAVIRKIRYFAADVIFRGTKVIMTEEESCNPVEWTKGYEQGVKDSANLIAGEPAVDAVEVVRCRHCKYHHYICISGFVDRKEDDFCSYGEPRMDGE